MTVHRFDFEAIGTGWSIQTPDPIPDELRAILLQRIDDFDLTYSRFRSDSMIGRFAASGGSCELPPDAVDLLAFYRVLYDISDGRVNPLVGRRLEHLGYDASYSLRRDTSAAPVPAWADDVLTVSGSLLTAAEPVLLDVGAAGKGYLVDILADLLATHGLSDFLVDAGGDMVHRGPRSCLVGLEDPTDASKVVGVANLREAALCGSATNRRAWGAGLHHIIDPATGEPADRFLATWVIAESAMVADGLATALFLTEPTELAQRFRFSYVRMPIGGGLEYSTNFDGELFCS